MTNSNSIRFSASITIVLAVLLCNIATAETASFKKAVSIFKEGYAHCTEAQRIRSQDVNLAMARFATYLDLKDKAASIDEEILSTKLHNIAREIEFCEKAHEDILRAKAFPIMESAIDSCEKSKSQLTKLNSDKAIEEYSKYETLYNQANEITTSISKVSSVLIKTNRCNKLKRKIEVAKNEIDKAKSSFAEANLMASNALSQCQSAKKLVEKEKNVSQQKIVSASSLLDNANIQVASIQSRRAKSPSYKKYANLQINQQIDNKLVLTNNCIKRVKLSITNGRKLLKNKESERLRLAKEKLEKEKIAAEKARAERLKIEEALHLAEKEALKRQEEERQASLRAIEEQRIQEEEAKKRKLAEEELQQKELAKSRLKLRRQSSDWTASVEKKNQETNSSQESDSPRNSKKAQNDWRFMTN